MAQLQHFTDFLLISLLLPTLASCTDNFTIYRAGFQGNIFDSFQTPESVCETSSPSCHDYNAQKTSCNSCSCPSSNDTFGYVKDFWRCFGKEELRQEKGCYVEVKGQQNPEHFYVAKSSGWIYLNLSLYQECTYNYSSDTYYRTCDGNWSAAGSIGSGTRYALHKVRHQSRMRYRIRVRTDDVANSVFEGRIMKLNFECKTRGPTIWSGCFIFKESYLKRPITCQSASPTFSPSEEPATSGPQASNVYTSSSTPNTTYSNQASNGARVYKNVIIGVSAGAGVILVVIVTVVCIVCCKRRQRSDISKYTAALYDSSQSPAGIYAETSIRLPSTSKSFTAGSHSNPAYERGRDVSIGIGESRVNPSPSHLQSTPARLHCITNESFEAETPAAPRAPKPRTVKQRGNMLVKYENVTVLADELRPESVPDAERFYDNPCGHSPEYHVLENPEEVPSYCSYPAGLQIQDNSPSDLSQSSFEESLNQTESYTNDVTEPDEPIYMNSPAIPSCGPRDNTAFFFDVPQNESDTNALSDQKTIDYDDSSVQEYEDIYANSEAIRDSYAHDNAAENPGYDPDDEELNHDDDAPIDEPIYDNPSAVGDRDGHALTGDSPLLNNQSDDSLYQDLGSARKQESDYQSLTPVTVRKIRPKPRPKPKPKPQQ